MKTHATNEAAAQLDRQITAAEYTAQLQNAHAGSAASTLQRYQELANGSPRVAQLKQRAQMTAGGPAAATLQRYQQLANSTLQAMLHPRAAGTVVQRITVDAAIQARDAGQSVWVRDADEHWARGIIRDVTPEGMATVELADAVTRTAPVDEIRDTPPPDAGLSEAQNTLATVDSGPASMTGSAQAAASSPEIQHYYQLLVALSEDERKRQVRDLARSLHPDRAGGNADEFKAFWAALDLVRNGPPPAQQGGALQQEPSAPALDLGLPPSHDAPDIALPNVEIGRELAGQPFSEAEAGQLGLLRQVHGPADLARLAGTGITAPQLIALAQLRTAATLDDLVALAGLAQPAALLAQLETLPVVVGWAELQTLSGLLATRPVGDIVAIAGIGSPAFAAPTLQNIVQLCALPKTAAQIAILSAQPGIAGTPSLLALAGETADRDTAGDTWYDLNQRWEAIQAGWQQRWPLAGVFTATTAAWSIASQLVRAFVRNRENPASAADLQQFALAVAAMRSTLDLINQMEPALDQGRQTLVATDARLVALTTLLTEIDNQMLPFYAGPSPARATATAQRLLVVNAQTALTLERTQLVNDRAAFAALGAVTAPVVAQAILDQQARAANVAAVPALAVLDAPLAAIRTAAFQQRATYPNLNLNQDTVAHGFWQALTPGQRALFNTKVAGFPVANWGAQGYPGTRNRPAAYPAGPIQVPTLGGFPLQVGGEIVHDWIFPSHGHGRSAQQMNVMLGHALAGTPLPSVLGPLAPQNVVQPGRIVYGFANIAANIVVANGTLITFYSTL